MGLSKRTLTLLARAYDGPAQLKGGQVIERMDLRGARERNEEWRRLQPLSEYGSEGCSLTCESSQGDARRPSDSSDDAGPHRHHHP